MEQHGVGGHVAVGDGNPESGQLSAAERSRYARHLLLPDVGVAGQMRLRAARVLVVGAGGLGSPVLTYLAAAGVGTVGVVDDDVVDRSNLQRQVVHSTADVGRAKVESAADRIAQINPEVQVVAHPWRLTAERAAQVVAAYDVVVDATDNFPTRYLLSDACVVVGRPLVWGAVSRFDGQVSVWWPGKGPCYRCVFPRPPAPGLVPSCEQGGVLGVLPGVIGTWQATEVVKILLGIGEPLVGRMMVYDALAATVGQVRLSSRPDCPSCGPNATVVLRDDPLTCGVVADGDAGTVSTLSATAEPTDLPHVDARTAARLVDSTDVVLLDVRESTEREVVTLPARRALWRPLGQVLADPTLPEVPLDATVVVYCRSGVRSAKAVAALRAAGYTSAMNLAGGLGAWRDDVDSHLPLY
ncbi:putative adenylyltransferase/sulfurtransferase MoeZ [Austwickia sp. TVS 96-490-7B]|uniref:molybdopterin-synthase adenylyltransferase MoeB n=1 Tax=Austwickia sp. TVS 96-490-7B TaxID=2830843 RepID=UPI001C589E40|nr:molybdopterin-synthase adenylyltransferase MoeB [Austwickia sp. TVS 96-490-7B]MBW3086624.1 putative adenylyltransferase/sulfurtransferase MoeZ [Austwickia sp. TVS 96-490-7B]